MQNLNHEFGSKEKPYDLIIIGTGPAGMSAAVYAARYKMKVMMIGSSYGGMIAGAHKVGNYLGFEEISGDEITKKFVDHVKYLKVPIEVDTVSGIFKKEDLKLFEILAHGGIYYSKKVLLATGAEKKRLAVKGEEEFSGKGVSYCATCDAAFFGDKTVAVVGGGDSALTSALVLAEFASKVYIVYRKDAFFRAEPTWVEKIVTNPKIEVIFKANLSEIKGDVMVSSAVLDNGRELELDGVFIEVGSEPNTTLLGSLDVKFDGNYIEVDKEQHTSVCGLFAAGDVTNNPLKQVITAAAEGSIAVFTAFKELRKECE